MWLILAAWAQSPTDDVGKPIAGVTLSAPRGGLPDASLQTLLRAKQGERYDPTQIRQDLTTLFRVGDFRSVEAELTPWFVVDEAGNTLDAVNLTYEVLPAPRVQKLTVEGQHDLSKRQLLEASGLSPGQVFYPELDAARAARSIRTWMNRKGYVDANVTIDPEPVDDDHFDVTITIDEGVPNRLAALSFIGDIPPELGTKPLTRWARRSGLKVGKPISSDAIQNTQLELRQRLAGVVGGWFQKRRGWTAARVSPAVTNDDGRVDVRYAIEPGPRLELVVEGLRWRPEKRVRDALGINQRVRLTKGFIDEADERMEAWLARQGLFKSRADIELRGGSSRSQTLFVSIDRGPSYTLRGRPPRKSLAFIGNEHATDAELTRVADQASDDVIRLDYFTQSELEKGLAAMKNVYRARGYQQATFTLESMGDKPVAKGLIKPFVKAWSAFVGQPEPRRLFPLIRVNEGPLTRLVETDLLGAAPEVNTDDFRKRLTALNDGPYDPLSVERIRRELLERHRQQGYLQADVQTSNTIPRDGTVRATIRAVPGPRVLIRSVVTRGATLTRPSLLRREMQFELGQPLTSTGLDQARRQLYDLGIFRSVGTQLLGQGQTRDLLVTVQERPKWAAEAGAGLNTDQGARLLGRLTRRNLFGRAHRFDAYGLVGVDYLSDSVTDWRPDLGSIEWRAALSYTAPHLPLRRSETVVDLLLQERRQELTWRMARTGLGLSMEVDVGDHTNLQFASRFELRDLDEVDKRALLPGEVWDVRDQRQPRLGVACRLCRLTQTVQAVALHDRRDDPVRPTRGWSVSAVSEWAPGIRLDANDTRVPFLKGEVRFGAFLPVGGLTLRINGEGGYARGLNQAIIPLEDRFRLGGTGSLRGFRRQSVGPRNEAARVDVDWPNAIAPVLEEANRDAPARWVPTGGDTRAVAVAELLVPLPAVGLPAWDGYAGALFVDVGNVWQTGAGTPTSNTLGSVPALRYGAGAGVRVETPVGPLQFDLASNLQAALARGERRELLVERWEEPSLRAHLSLGALW